MPSPTISAERILFVPFVIENVELTPPLPVMYTKSAAASSTLTSISAVARISSVFAFFKYALTVVVPAPVPISSQTAFVPSILQTF